VEVGYTFSVILIPSELSIPDYFMHCMCQQRFCNVLKYEQVKSILYEF